MSNGTQRVSLLVEALQRRGRRESISEIARTLGVSRKTVTRYLRVAARHGWSARGPELSRPQLEAMTHELWAGRSSPSEAELLPRVRQIREAVASGRSVVRLLEDLRRSGVGVSYSSLHRFIVKHL